MKHVVVPIEATNPQISAIYGIIQRNGGICEDVYQAAIAAAPDTGMIAVQGWQPIETAPRGRDILVYTGKHFYVAEWVQHPFTGDVAFRVIDLGDGLSKVCYPTHWQELPEPPQALKDMEG